MWPGTQEPALTQSTAFCSNLTHRATHNLRKSLTEPYSTKTCHSSRAEIELLAGGLGSFSLSNMVIAHLQEEEKVRAVASHDASKTGFPRFSVRMPKHMQFCPCNLPV